MTGDVDVLCASLDRGVAEKIALMAPWVEAGGPGELLDVGMGGGAVSARLASLFPGHAVSGVDVNAKMVRFASTEHARGNLRFAVGDAMDSHARGAAAVVLSSVLHEVYSHAGHSLEAVELALRSAWQSLRPGGRLIVRDFVRPQGSDRPVVLEHRRSDIVTGHDFGAFAESCPWPVALDAVRSDREWVSYATDLGSAYDYLLRKDFHELWDHQLVERYGFWSRTAAEAMIRRTGFRIVHSSVWRGAWVTRRRLRDKVRVRCRRTQDLLAPAHQLLIVASKQRS